MQVKSIRILSGRNIYSHKKVIRLVVDIGELHNTPTKEIPGFNENLIRFFPGIAGHFCSAGYEGGFLERLMEGTYLSHVTEHLILELQNLAGYSVSYGKARVVCEPSLYMIVAEYSNEGCANECARAAVSIINSLAAGENIDRDAMLERIREVSTETELGPSTRAVYLEAMKRGIPVTRLGNEGLIQLGYGKYSRLMEASMTDAVSCISVDVAGNKQYTKEILNDNNIPVPQGDLAYSFEGALIIAEELGYPVVVKPVDGNQGKGVTPNISNADALRSAYDEAAKFNKVVVVERYIKGNDYRVLVVGDRVSAVSERIPPSVVGDGVKTVRQLSEEENRNKLRGYDHEKPLTKIRLDGAAAGVLAREGLDWDYVPREGQKVKLRDNCNLSTGGTAKDRTGEIHPFNATVAVKAAKAVCLDIAGIDITAEDISRPLGDKNGAVIEVNASPGLRMHVFPSEGESRNVASDIIEMLYPKDKPFTIPIISITGTNGKTTTTRLIKHTLGLCGKTVGMTSTSGIFIGDECVLKGDNTGYSSARRVLSDKRVEAAVLETARGGIIKKGLGYDLADVGVIINISDDHLGSDGMNSIEDMAHVKSLVIEAVKPDGYAVLNADDPMAGYLLQRVRSRTVLFSRDRENPLVRQQMNTGGRCVYTDRDHIFIWDSGDILEIAAFEEIPITFGGLVECNIENSLAAVAALYSINVPVGIIKTGLRSFKPDASLNPGRFNIFEMGGFKVMLDYSHNTAGYAAVSNFITRIAAKRLVGVIGMPGDRLERSIREVGRICSKVFSKVYIKEDKDLRGRYPGEVAEMLRDSVVNNGMKRENVEVIFDELKALEAAMLDAQPGDLIIMFYEEFDAAEELLSKFKQEMDKKITVTV